MDKGILLMDKLFQNPVVNMAEEGQSFFNLHL